MSITKKIPAFYEKPELLMKLFGWVSAGVMLFNMVLICCDVFMRYVFNAPIQGATEIVTMLMAWVAYAGMGYTLLKGQHMQLGAIYDKLQGRTKHIISLIIYVLASILFIVMIKASWDQFWASWLIKEKSVAAVTVYVFIGKFGTFLGWLLLAIQSLFMSVYCVVGVIYPNRVDHILIKSELPSQEDLSAFGSDEQKNTRKEGNN
ncbi:TRAP transporter small permease subunit [Flavonifractor sp. AGMB03687]|uniref:TRAP transporter small permease subunit n=1 Tax=Flavonifractor sp. AGMB03687 TaxID=2785133 RepID=UPI001AE0A520|nr:TRAP transporter small permease subunit [Flavonifractor sp. AGMB03687]